MTTLIFQGPIQIRDIKELNDIVINNPDLNNPGIYIWGFMYRYDYDKKQGIEPINYKKEEIAFPAEGVQFIPYYVGKDEKSISRRINQHHNILSYVNAQKYTRFSRDYMKCFFRKDFPVNKGNNTKASIAFIKRNPNSIQYINKKECLELIYPNIILHYQDGYPILQQKFGGAFSDTLSDLIIGKHNLWFCYATKPKVTNIALKEFETYTFWSLKGKTISRTGKCPTANSLIKICDKTKTDIFDYAPTVNFDGY